LRRPAIQNNADKIKIFYRRRTYNVLPFQVPLTMSISAALTNITAKMGCKGKKIF